MSRINNIVEGWGAYFQGENLDPKIKQLAEKRAEICVKCEHFNHSIAYSIIDRIASAITNTAKLDRSDVQGGTCNLCHCAFPAKLMVPAERCPHQPNAYWDAEEIS